MCGSVTKGREEGPETGKGRLLGSELPVPVTQGLRTRGVGVPPDQSHRKTKIPETAHPLSSQVPVRKPNPRSSGPVGLPLESTCTGRAEGRRKGKGLCPGHRETRPWGETGVGEDTPVDWGGGGDSVSGPGPPSLPGTPRGRPVALGSPENYGKLRT